MLNILESIAHILNKHQLQILREFFIYIFVSHQVDQKLESFIAQTYLDW